MTHFTSNNAYGSFILRFALGLILLAHGLLKLLVFTPAGTVGYFESLGLPAVAAHLTIFAEIAGGTALILGLYTRLVALLTIPVLLGATWVHLSNGWLFSNTGGGWEFPALLVALSVSLVFQGPGVLALRSFPALDRFIPAALKD